MQLSVCSRIIKEGKLQAQEILNDKNRKTYLVPLEALDEELQQKWYQMNLENPPEEISTPEPVTDKKAVDHFSESERQEIDFWISLVEQWQQYRMKPGVTCKADVDKKFVTLCGLEYPDKEISVDILYRKWKAVKENDLDGLIDKRGKWKREPAALMIRYGRRFCISTLMRASIRSRSAWTTPRCGLRKKTGFIHRHSKLFRFLPQTQQRGAGRCQGAGT